MEFERGTEKGAMLFSWLKIPGFSQRESWSSIQALNEQCKIKHKKPPASFLILQGVLRLVGSGA